MANIVISELRPAGSDLFMDSESYLTDLTDNELHMTQGGGKASIIISFTIGFTVGITITISTQE
jgi:hypothetical protein